MIKPYIMDLGNVVNVLPHEKDSDGVNHHCDVRLRDTGQSFTDVPVLSPRKGFACIPEVGDLVLVGFMGGDMYKPVILGTVYSDEVKPPIYYEGESILVVPEYKNDKPKREELKRYYFEMPKTNDHPGMKLLVREEDVHYELDKYKFDLKYEDGIKLEVNEKTSLAISKDGDITITAKDTKVSIDKEGVIAIDSKQKVGIKTSAEVSLESSGGDMKLSANNITLKGTQSVKIEGTQSVELKGATAKMQADGNLELKGTSAKIEGSASLEAKGAIATVEATGIMNVKGSLVNIN